MAKVVNVSPYRGIHNRIEFEVNDPKDILYPNFAGTASAMNNEGYRNFNLKLTEEEDVQKLRDLGMYVKDRNDGTWSIKINIMYKYTTPAIYLTTGDTSVEQTEATLANLQNVEIISVPHLAVVTYTGRNGSECANVDEMEVEKRASAWRDKMAKRMVPAVADTEESDISEMGLPF